MFTQRHVVGDLSDHGLPPPTEGPISQLKRRGAGTAIVDPDVVDAIRDGTIEIVPAVQEITAEGALLDKGDQVRADAIIAATGYTTGLADMVGHLGVLDDRQMPARLDGGEAEPGLRFVGYLYRPGLTRMVGRTARRIARDIAPA
jgi:cation diffusion facilitator CzcD-associated flavoprotein CzcO